MSFPLLRKHVCPAGAGQRWLSLLQEKVVSVWECLRGVIPRGIQKFTF